MANWERRWNILLYLICHGPVKAKRLMDEFEVADSTIREDIAHLSLSFPIESRRGPYGGYHIAQGQRPFAKHVACLAALSQQLIQMNLVSELQDQLMQEAILALLSISSDISHVHFDSTVMTVNA